ncbi:MAG: hypothetical protein ACXAEU_16810 [Candidatus Hodarchaeales archaeon]|jgi:hypothetical protein
MSLTQFGSILTFAANLEGQLAKYYEEASKDTNIHAEEFTGRAKACIKRKRRLERSRRENVTEITLEPIEGLDATNYKLDLANSFPQVIDANEELIIRFYSDVTPKINVLESRRVLQRCQKEHNHLRKLLE